MRKSTVAIAFVALAGALGTAAYAQQQTDDGMRGPMMMRLQKAMKDSDGAITFDQFSDVMDTQLKKMIADNGGKITVEQLAAALEKARYERMAKQIMSRYDTKTDGTLTADDITSHEKKVFALMDKNNDGKIERNELPKGPGHHGKRHWHGGMHKKN